MEFHCLSNKHVLVAAENVALIFQLIHSGVLKGRLTLYKLKQSDLSLCSQALCCLHSSGFKRGDALEVKVPLCLLLHCVNLNTVFQITYFPPLLSTFALLVIFFIALVKCSPMVSEYWLHTLYY